MLRGKEVRTMACFEKQRSLWVPPFIGFTEFTPEIPKLYWDVRSQEQRMHTLCEQLHKLVCYADMLGEKININRDDVDELIEMFNKFKESGFEDYYEKQIAEWIEKHMPDIIEAAIKMVFFGLTQDGYFCAWIPNSWQGILFGTIADYSADNYGCLTLEY